LRIITFYLFGEILTRIYRRGLVHTTGAVAIGRVDVVTVHFCFQYYANRIGVRRRRRNTIAYAINEWAVRLLASVGERMLYRPGRVRRIVPVSKGLSNELQEYRPRTAHLTGVIPNGVDPSRFKPDRAVRHQERRALNLEGADLVALFLGGDWERKGLPAVLEALKFAPAWRLAVVGDGPEGRFAAAAEKLGVRDQVMFLGRRNDPERCYAMADIFVLPTAYEAAPLAGLEAAASGLPLVVTRVNGLEDLVEDQVNGFFVGADPADIGRRFQQLEDPRLRAEMSRAARVAGERWTWDDVTSAYVALYDELRGMQSPGKH
jgi:UDP-glucose:(heptosyl)LPS alpha-1,3-glucosyltransferase